ncbi:hypothetical protein [Bacillus thuringiensis]|uniref:Uncharacterized protein n=1 Tax=Bacillus thuringiensis DB27 TaxID=1431339 RepID=W8Y6D8_BACTU|nr:hypothetical protein [Bacillus thuringiensis]MBG9633897.1 hypothetical protein [Bacillus thuringiensis]MBG9668987.1 hypothetical protein [Bacillus thuringiensis]MBH0350721.1 hypothetical protein [Bacillus thuringiensis]CDN37054.1 unnamed protein product [Bacillus thuringiensis DB27]CDN39298.1 unnamed protein product [Bacillus thuringiensis DB27]
MLDSLSEKVLKYIILNSRHSLASTEIIDAFSTEPLTSVKDALGNLFQKEYIYGQYAEGSLHEIIPAHAGRVYFEMKEKSNTMNPSGSTVFNIQQATNSILGNQQHASINQTTINFESLKELVASKGEADNPEIQELIALLQNHLEQNTPLEKGMLSRFGDVLAQHPWLSNPLGQWIIQALTGLSSGL